MAGKRGHDASFSCGLTGKLGGASSSLGYSKDKRWQARSLVSSDIDTANVFMSICCI